MKQLITRTTFIIVLLVGLGMFTACEDHHIPHTEPRFRIKRTEVGSLRTRTITTYNYRPDGKLDDYLVQFAIDDPNGLFTKLQYDAQNRLIGTQRTARGLPTVRTAYAYDDSGNVTSVKEYTADSGSENYSLTEEKRFEYDGANKFPAKVVVLNPAGQISQTQAYTYENGNIVKLTLNSSQVQTFQYDDKPNPYQSLSTINYGYTIFSRNNWIDSRNYTITYNENGLLTNRGNAPGNLFYSERIEYEQY